MLRLIFRRYNLLLIFFPIILGIFGILALFSAGNGSWQPWAGPHAIRLAFCLLVMLAVGLIPLNRLLTFALPFYYSILFLLILVLLVGDTALGAQRWIGLWKVNLQPSELMRLAVIVCIARFYHYLKSDQQITIIKLLPVFGLVLLPMILILLQPDLGTALILGLTAITVTFIIGLRKRFFIFGGCLVLAAIPFAWQFLHDYQKKRIFTFLNPEADPLGGGYHIIQSKIALGSGGLTGQGFLQGTQNQLAFLPETHTDFIFTVIGEEFGLLGTMSLIFTWVTLVVVAFRIGLTCRFRFGKVLGCGIGILFFYYFFINNAMIAGLLPVVGVPMPIVSYGGSAMLSSFLALGFLQSIYAWRNDEFAH